MNHISSPQVTGESVERILQNHSNTKTPDAAYSVTAQRLYEAHAQYGQLFDGLIEHWDNLEPEARAAWIAAAKVV